MARYIDVDNALIEIRRKMEESDYLHPEEDWVNGLIMADNILMSMPVIFIDNHIAEDSKKDLISRADALSCFHDWIDSHGDVHTADEMPEYQRIEQLPPAHLEKRTQERTETHACENTCEIELKSNDMISRADALDALGEEPPVWYDGEDEIAERNQWRRDVNAIKAVPSAQPKAQLSEESTTSDCIDRQTAIDTLNEYFARIGKLKRRGLTKGEKAISLDTVGTIKTLPSARPESNCSEIPNGSDAISRQAAIDELIAMREHIDAEMSVIGLTAYEMAIEALREPKVETQMSSADCISRQYAIDAVLGVIPYDDYWKEQVEKAIFALPSAQPDFDMTGEIDKAHDDGYEQGYLQGKADYERKPGKWINGHWDGDSNFRIDGRGNCWFVRECSNCHEEIQGKPTKYCPNCGCRMLKEGEEHD